MKRSFLGRAAISFEMLESRTLLSAMPMGGAEVENDSEGHDGNHDSPEVHAHLTATTPITDLTGNALALTGVVQLPAVQLPGALKRFSGMQGFLPAVQDVATLTSATTPVKLRGYSAMIDWGDGSAPTRGQLVVDRSGLIHIKGRHAYSAIGAFTVTVTVTQHLPAVQNPTGAPDPTLVITSTDTITQNSTGGVTVNPTTGQEFTGVVGSFTTTASTDPTAFTAIISWGDKHRSLGTVTLNADGSFSVSGTHTYGLAGSYRVVVLVFQHTNPSMTASKSDDVSDHAGDDAGWHLGWRKHGFFDMILSTAVVADAPVVPVTPPPTV